MKWAGGIIVGWLTGEQYILTVGFSLLLTVSEVIFKRLMFYAEKITSVDAFTHLIFSSTIISMRESARLAFILGAENVVEILLNVFLGIMCETWTRNSQCFP